MHDLVSDLIGYHNDFITLPKKLHWKVDVINLVLVVQAASELSLEEAYLKALEMQDALPCFEKLQSIVENYTDDLGIGIQGSYSWHIKNTE